MELTQREAAPLCVVQRQCLDPRLTYDAPDCVMRRACEPGFYARPTSHLTSTHHHSPPAPAARRIQLVAPAPAAVIHALPQTWADEEADVDIPVMDVFLLLLLAIVFIFLAWAAVHAFVC